MYLMLQRTAQKGREAGLSKFGRRVGRGLGLGKYIQLSSIENHF
jgi:hypothetical protein